MHPAQMDCIDTVSILKEMRILTMKCVWAAQDSRTKMDAVREIPIRRAVQFSFLTIPRDKFLTHRSNAGISKYRWEIPIA